MTQNEQKTIRWQIPEHRTPERGKRWYLIAGLAFLVCVFFSFFEFQGWQPVFLGMRSNFLFILILIIGAVIMVVNSGQEPMMVDAEIGPEGVKLGSKFYDYDAIKHFAIIYKPKQGIKTLYFEFKNPLKFRLSLPLRGLDPTTTFNYLKQYLEIDEEMTAPPLSEQLTKLLKL